MQESTKRETSVQETRSIEADEFAVQRRDLMFVDSPEALADRSSSSQPLPIASSEAADASAVESSTISDDDFFELGMKVRAEL